MRAPGTAARAAADVVAGSQRLGAEFPRGAQEVGELDGLVAGDTGNGRFAGDVALGERVDDGLAEPLLVVEDIVRDAERLGDAPRVGDVLPGAARSGAMSRGAVIVELQRHADDVVAFALQHARHDRRIDAAGHGDDDPRLFWAGREIQAVHRRSFTGRSGHFMPIRYI